MNTEKKYFTPQKINEEKYNQDEQQLLKFFIEDFLMIDEKRKKHKEHDINITEKYLELIIRPECNQTCEYCYLYKYGKDLYPTRSNKEETLKNIDLILDYFYIQNNTYSYYIQLFGGDLFYDDILFDIFDLLEKYFIELKNKYPFIFFETTNIMIPCNLSVIVERPEVKEKLLKYIDKFYDTFKVRIRFSWSTDGIVNTDTREKKELSEEYFDTIFNFCKEAGAWYHPMISAQNVCNQKENYKWWIEKINNLYDEDDTNDFQPMFLEVRNDEWTQESIDAYLEFLTFAMEERYKMCNKDFKDLAHHLFNGPNSTLKNSYNYDFLKIYFKMINNNSLEAEGMTCAIQKSIVFNCTNLSLVPCHRTTYTQFTAGYFQVENDKIIDITPQNVSSYITIHTLNKKNLPMCIKCPINDICLHGCLGAQYEKAGDLLLTCNSVCSMFKQKFYHLFKLYNEYNLFNIALEENLISEDLLKNIYKIIEGLEEELL